MSKVNLQLRDAVLQAAQRRSEGQSPASSPVIRDDPSFTDFDKGYQMRTELRRMIDVGILGMVNDHEASKEGVASLKTLLKLADKIIENPDNEKYQRIKINNPTIKKDIMEPKGALEFAIKVCVSSIACEQPGVDWFVDGISTAVIEMEAYRVFIPKYRDDLVLCASLLKKAIDREHLRLDERLKLARENEEKEEQRAIAMKRFVDDRKKKEEDDRRERDARQSSNVAATDSGSNDDLETVPAINCSPTEVRLAVTNDDDDQKPEVDVHDADGLGTVCCAQSLNPDTAVSLTNC
ncbi:hypothetical protein ARMGADRAFT_740969 [Armillaria gallica]|uniref:PUB domain-containing protein n=1 Tax=Armillaria gallica TaxID=47427 RepID=A0A2H3D1Q3_ARMGA|nr:hypothetical protein ARMGADRAFT_740969 [Armillaria gallica]